MMYPSSSDSDSSGGSCDEDEERVMELKKHKQLKLKPTTIKCHTDVSRMIQELPLTNS